MRLDDAVDYAEDVRKALQDIASKTSAIPSGDGYATDFLKRKVVASRALHAAPTSGYDWSSLSSTSLANFFDAHDNWLCVGGGFPRSGPLHRSRVS